MTNSPRARMALFALEVVLATAMLTCAAIKTEPQEPAVKPTLNGKN